METREHAERSYWQTSDLERPGAWSAELLTLKMSEARVLLEKLDAFEAEFCDAKTILEIGAGQGWASCFVQQKFPNATVLTSEFAPEALASLGSWAGVVGSGVAGAFAARAEQLPVADASIDVAFAFAAAHHFGNFPATLRELRRVLSPSGVAVFFHEPSCPAWIYPAAHRRVNKKRPAVPEDVIKYRELAAIAEASGLSIDVRFAPTTTARGAIETVYYLALQRMRFLQRRMPCTADYVMRRC